MSPDENKDLVRRWVRAWNDGRPDDVDTLAAPGYVRHDPNGPEVRGAESEKRLIAMYLSAFPDLHFTVEDLIAEGDKVAARLTARGTHRGELLGVPASGNPVEIQIMELYRLEAGRVAEQWVMTDALGMMQQIGAIPVP